MAKLMASQVAARVGVTSYTIKRWYNSLESMDKELLAELISKGMPELPAFEVVGSMGWRYWNEDDIDKIIAFKQWIDKHYPTRNGIFSRSKQI